MRKKSKKYNSKVKNFACLPTGRNFCLVPNVENFFRTSSGCRYFGIVLPFSFLLLTLPGHFSFAQEQTDTQAAGEQTEPKQPAIEIPVNSLIWIEDSLPEGATTTGEWIWVKDIKFSGENSHTDGVKTGLHSHSFNITNPIKLEETSVIEQYVYLDPKNPPKGIMLKLIPSQGRAIDLYWEGEEEVFAGTTEYIEAWYMGILPEEGKWQKLIINLRELELAPLEISGISFITYDGKSCWDTTVILNQGSK